MKTIDLEKILDNYLEVDCDYSYTRESILMAMKEACRQTLELAAENATTLKDNDPNMNFYTIDKQSILNTINQVE